MEERRYVPSHHRRDNAELLSDDPNLFDKAYSFRDFGRDLVSCPALLLTTSSLAGTPSPGPLRLKKTPAAGHPLPQGGEGRGSEGVLSTIKWDRTLEGNKGFVMRGHQYRISDFATAVLMAQLTRLDELCARREKHAAYLQDELTESRLIQ
jgi:dTDP-4-amino-4,6-dideoxygalactose transaminase